MDHQLITTMFELPGYHITKNLGLVRGITVRSRSVLGSIGASFQQMMGGNVGLYTELCEKAREEAYDIMVSHASAIGANAVVAVRYDANDIADGVTEVLCYGSAVTVQQA